MHGAVSILTDEFPRLLARLPAGLDLDRLAAEHGALSRRREITGGAALLRLALARGPGGLSLRETAAWAALIGLARLSNPGVKYRLDRSADFLAALIGELLAAKAAASPACWHGRVLRLADSSSLSQPGSAGTDWRVHAVFDLRRGGFSALQLSDAHGAESLLRGDPVAGEVRIGDRNFAHAPALAAFRAASRDQADFIVRLRWNGLRLRDAQGRPFDLIAGLATLPPGDAPQQVALQAVVGRDQATLPLRLVIQRKPAAATKATREALRRTAARKQKTLDPRSLIAAGFMILATSLPEAGFPAEQILAAYRLRWQIELAFKRLKSLLRIDRLPTHTERGSRSWLNAHLVMALLCDDVSQDLLEASP